MTEGQKSAYKRRAGKKAHKTAGSNRWVAIKPLGKHAKAYKRWLEG